MTIDLAGGEQTIATIQNAAGVILAVSENRAWIEVFFDGDLMHTQTVDLPAGVLFDIYVEEIPHKTTVYEHPRIFFSGPRSLSIGCEGNRVIVKGAAEKQPDRLL